MRIELIAFVVLSITLAGMAVDDNETSNMSFNELPTIDNLKPDKLSPQPTNTVVKWVASATDPDSEKIRYSFWQRKPSIDRTWKPLQNWTNQSQFSWTPEYQGEYEVQVRVRDIKNTDPDKWDDNCTANYTIYRPPTMKSLKPDKLSPQPVNTTVKWVASATDPDGEKIRYSFWQRKPSIDRTWKPLQNWTNQSQFSWTPEYQGEYEVQVRIRDVKNTDPDKWDDNLTANYSIELKEPPSYEGVNHPPRLHDLKPNRTGPSDVGTDILWTANATDAENDTITYEFILNKAGYGNEWTKVQTGSENVWLFTPLEGGHYCIQVRVKDQNYTGNNLIQSYYINSAEILGDENGWLDDIRTIIELTIAIVALITGILTLLYTNKSK